MTTIFDAHSHCFPPLGQDRGIMERRLAEHQYHLRFHGQGIRRKSDHAEVGEPLLVGQGDGISWLPEVNFRIGQFGRVEFTQNGEDYYIQWMPPTLWDMSSSPEYIIAQMDYVGVDRAVLQHDRIYGRLDDFLSDCVRRYPERFVALAQVDEWVGGGPQHLERVRHEVQDLGFSGLYFSTGGFFHADFKIGVNDPGLEPLWDLVAELGVPMHWYAATLRQPRVEQYLNELVEFTRWGRNHPHIRSVLTHGVNNISINRTGRHRFTVPPELITLLQLPNWRIELMLHLMNSDAEFPPYDPELRKVVLTLANEVGIEKLLWGSDMPACERTVTYRQSMLLFETQCDFLTANQRADILGGNLARLYPIP